MKRISLLLAIVTMLALTSCCRYHGMPMYWEPVNIKMDLEKKDLKTQQHLPDHSER